MPIGGHPPGLDPAFGLLICTTCQAGDHGNCRRYVYDRPRHRVTFCECPGVVKRGREFVVLPCLSYAVGDLDAR